MSNKRIKAKNIDTSSLGLDPDLENSLKKLSQFRDNYSNPYAELIRVDDTNLDYTAENVQTALELLDSDIASLDSDVASLDSSITDLETFQSNVQWASGRYSGDNSVDRLINVGFNADIIIISESDDYYGVFGTGTGIAGYIFTSKNNACNNYIYIDGNNFHVSISYGGNKSGIYYQWVAIKLG